MLPAKKIRFVNVAGLPANKTHLVAYAAFMISSICQALTGRALNYDLSLYTIPSDSVQTLQSRL
jgi:hypothetical protein